jgi:hypothetical protein
VMFWDTWEKMCNEKDCNFRATTHPRKKQKTTEFVTNNNMVIVPQPPYSPDLAPWFRFASQIESETEGMTFWNSVWHPKWITSGTR